MKKANHFLSSCQILCTVSLPLFWNPQPSTHIHTHLNKIQNTFHPKAHEMHGHGCARTHIHTLAHAYKNTQDSAISQHPQHIRPLLIPPRSSVQCSCIYRSHANTLLFLRHSVLITFPCFLHPPSKSPSIPPCSSVFLRLHKRRQSQRGVGVNKLQRWVKRVFAGK